MTIDASLAEDKALWLKVLCIICGAVFLGGCSANGPPTFTVEPGEYVTAFETTRDVLRNRRYPVDRIDADQGVITTASKPSSGLATPWDMDQTTLKQEVSDLVNQQSRRVRVSFASADGDGKFDQSAASIGTVEVVIYRMQDYSLRPSTRALLHSTRSTDNNLTARGIASQYEVATYEDSRLANRLAREIEKKLAKQRGRPIPAPAAAIDQPAASVAAPEPVTTLAPPVTEVPATPPAGPADGGGSPQRW